MEEPRSFLVEPAKFGEGEAEWAPASGQSLAAVSAAFVQHRVSMAVETSRQALGLQKGELADEIAANRGALKKKLNGTSPMSLGDLLALGLLLGSPVLGELADSVRDPIPAAYQRWLADWTPGSGVLPALRPPGAPRFTELAWNRFTDRFAQCLTTARQNRIDRLADSSVIRHWAIESLLDEGIRGEELFVSDVDGDLILELGTLRRSLMATVVNWREPDSSSETQAICASIAAAAMSIFAHLANERVLLIVTRPAVMSAFRQIFAQLATGTIGAIVQLEWHEMGELLGASDAAGLEVQILADGTNLTSDAAFMVLLVEKVMPPP